MARIVDRYVLRQFVQFYLICFLSLVGLYIVIDAFGRLDHFTSHSKEGGSLLTVMGRYYGYKSLAFFNQTSGVLALIAAMFTVTWSQRHNEMTALMAAGVPRLRVLRPVILAAIATSLAAAAARELVIPGVRHELAADTKNLGGDSPTPITPRWDNQTDVLLGGEAALVNRRTIQQPVFKLPPELAR
ncbi:MAG: LptF/LptG family permease, partial [Planctomycetota bacterium]